METALLAIGAIGWAVAVGVAIYAQSLLRWKREHEDIILRHHYDRMRARDPEHAVSFEEYKRIIKEPRRHKESVIS